MAKKALGRGFDTLLPTNFDRSILQEEQSRIQQLSVTDIEPNPDQPRKIFQDGELEELAASIKRHGILQPLIVLPSKEGKKHRIVAGERRWRAAQIAGVTSVPVIVRSLKELEELEISLIENVQRVDLNPLEQAASIVRLHDEFNIEYKDIAKNLGKAETTISNMVRLLQLPDAAKEALFAGSITEGHARALLSLKDKPEMQGQLLTKIISNGWSVRQAEQFASAEKKNPGEMSKNFTEAYSELSKNLSKHLKAKVQIKQKSNKKSGTITIAYRDEEALQHIIKSLEK